MYDSYYEITPRPHYQSVVETARQILDLKIEVPEFIIDSLIPRGLTLLGGREKLGKSVFTLDALALPIITGGKSLGQYQAVKGKFIYIALEETDVRLQKRLRERLKLESNGCNLDDLLIIRNFPSFTKGGIDSLYQEIEIHQPACVAIDTVGIFQGSSGAIDRHEFEYNFGRQLWHLSHDFGIGIVCITHTVKSSYDDKFNNIRGSGVQKAADTLIVMDRIPEFPNSVELSITGRDIENKNINLTYQKEFWHWEVDTSDAFNAKIGRPKNELDVTVIFGELRTLTYPLIHKRCQHLYYSDISESTVKRFIKESIDNGIIERTERGLYSLVQKSE